MTANPLSPLPGGPAPAAAPAANSRFTPLDPIRIVRQYAKWLLAAAVLGLAVGAAVYFVLNRYAPTVEPRDNGVMNDIAAAL